MRIAPGRIHTGDPFVQMAVEAEALAVADNAHAGVGGRLLIMHGDEVGPVHRTPQRSIERKSRRDLGDVSSVA